MSNIKDKRRSIVRNGVKCYKRSYVFPVSIIEEAEKRGMSVQDYVWFLIENDKKLEE